jgi:hypothetical protein
MHFFRFDRIDPGIDPGILCIKDSSGIPDILVGIQSCRPVGTTLGLLGMKVGLGVVCRVSSNIHQIF